MMRALFAAISGLRNHQLFMDVVGNNLANVNTAGFKAGRMTFNDLLSQTIASGSAPQGGLGGVNSKQVGLGTAAGAIDILQAQGSLQSTGKATDIAISGDGFFIMSDGSSQHFTRDGAFDLDTNGNLVNPTTGLKVQGWTFTSGVVNTTGAIGNLVVPLGQSTVAKQTDTALFTGNLNASAAAAVTAQAGLTVVDSQGASHPVTITLTRAAAANQWTVTASTTDATLVAGASTAAPAAMTFTVAPTIAFLSNGNLDTATTTAAPAGQAKGVFELTAAATPTTGATFGNGAAGTPPVGKVWLDFTKLTQLSGINEVTMTSQNGFQSGTLAAFKIGATGQMDGVYSNGQTRALGQLALANFQAPGGLLRIGNNMFDQSASSGPPLVGTPSTAGRGVTNAGVLEASNVDLAREFTNMIIGQRGFQANARVISASDELLQELVNLKR